MRPPEFTGGNIHPACQDACQDTCFNEAAGIHRRKQPIGRPVDTTVEIASMRPPEFTGGNAEGVVHDNWDAAVLQ